MTVRNYNDNAPQRKLNGAITSGATSLTLDSLIGLPVVYPYTATLGLGTASAEQILVTANPGGAALTVSRNYNGQGAYSHLDAETFDHTAIAKDYQEANAHVNATTGVHGVSGAVVGTSDTQVLTNKSLTSPTITGTGTATLASATVTGAVSAGSLTVGGAPGGVVPAGAVTSFAGAITPTGWLDCDGSTVSRTTYANLFGSLMSTQSVTSAVGNPVITVADSTKIAVGMIAVGTFISATLVSAIIDPTHVQLVTGAAVLSGTSSVDFHFWGRGDGATTFKLPDLRDKFVRGASTASPNATAGGSDTHSHALSANGWADLQFTTGLIEATKVTVPSYTGNSAATYTGGSTSSAATTSAIALGGATDIDTTLPSYAAVRFIIKT